MIKDKANRNILIHIKQKAKWFSANMLNIAEEKQRATETEENRQN